MESFATLVLSSLALYPRWWLLDFFILDFWETTIFLPAQLAYSLMNSVEIPVSQHNNHTFIQMTKQR